MKRYYDMTVLIFKCLFMGSVFVVSIANAQQTLFFGTVKTQNKVTQARFEVFSDGVIKTIVYAPYGISPIDLKDVKQRDKRLTFLWQINQLGYQCLLLKRDSSAYSGNCICENKQPIEITLREFTREDAILQGNELSATKKDIQILDRALNLLNNGSNWNRLDNRVCDNSLYPYQWTLFCALHQASIDVDSEYRHLRPAIQAVRQAIDEATNRKKYAHLLQDFNNEAKSFDSIAQVLTRAKEIITLKLKP